jgi:UDP-arabinose 4-epimerase
MTIAKEKILVTGGAGYIGSQICKALALTGYLPVSYDNLSTGNAWAVKWGPLETGDILDADRLRGVVETHRPAAAIHLAASALVGESVREPSLYYRNNVVGSLNVLDVCRAAGVATLIFASSCSVYGVPRHLPVSEDTAVDPLSPYGASKLMLERVLREYEAAYGLRYASLRYFNVAGADVELGECREVETHIIPLAIDAVLGQRGPFQVMGTDYPTPDGTAIRDYVHVCDLAEAHILALRHLLAGGNSVVCNLGSGKGHSVQQILDGIASVAGKTVPCVQAPRRVGDPPAVIADIATAAEQLNWSPRQSSLATLIASAWQWHAIRPRPASSRSDR